MTNWERMRRGEEEIRGRMRRKKMRRGEGVEEEKEKEEGSPPTLTKFSRETSESPPSPTKESRANTNISQTG